MRISGPPWHIPHVAAPLDVASKHCYSMRLVRPFLKALEKHPGFPADLLKPLWVMDADERIPIATALELMRGGIALTGDEDLGLKASREIERGDYGVLEYAVTSASTVGDALSLIGRYLALVNDALRFSLSVEGDRAVIMLDSAVMLPRTGADFQSASFARSTEVHRGFVAEDKPEIWFMHAQPANTDEYAKSFGEAKVRFNMPFNGFTLDAAALKAPMPAADPKLNELIRKQAEAMLAELPRVESFTKRVRELLLKELEGGNPSAVRVASLLHISSRTLTRRLEEERTSFKDLLDDLRRSLALRYVGTTDLGLSEIAFLLGFSQSAAFHRAFKRWTGMTPLEHRRARRGG